MELSAKNKDMQAEINKKSLMQDLKSPVKVVSKIMQMTAFQYFFTRISQAGFLLFVIHEFVNLEYAKIGIVIGSFISAGAGYALLRWAR